MIYLKYNFILLIVYISSILRILIALNSGSVCANNLLPVIALKHFFEEAYFYMTGIPMLKLNNLYEVILVYYKHYQDIKRDDMSYPFHDTNSSRNFNTSIINMISPF